MAPPALPENNTDRLFIYYQTGGGATAQEHVMTIRYDASTAMPFDIMDDLAGIIGTAPFMASLFDGWNVLRAETQLEGSIFRFPTTVPASLLAVVGSGLASATPAQQAREVRFIGRGLVSGRKVTMSLYGLIDAIIAETDFRFEPVGGTPLANLLTFMKGIGLTGAAFTNIGKGQTQWYDYVNWQYNSHWETEQRS
jgi:hypothetical protein